MIVLDGLDLNGKLGAATGFQIAGDFTFLDLSPDYKWAEKRIGAALIPNPATGNATLKLSMRYYGSSEDNVLTNMGALAAKAQKAEAQSSYNPIQAVVTPVGATNASTLDVLAVTISEVKYDHKHSRLKIADFTLTLTCKPFVFGPWASVKTGRKPAGIYAEEVQIAGVAGDVPGPARITVTNNGSIGQQFALLGLDGRGYASGNKLVLSASTFDYTTAPLNGTYTAGTNEVQTATKSGTISGGTFTLTYEGQTTSSLAYNATTATVQAALEALSTIGTGNITVGGSALSSGSMTFTFAGALAATDTSLIVLNSSLTGGGTAPITQTTQGAAGYVANTSLQSSYSDFMRTAAQTDSGSYDIWALVRTDAEPSTARVRATISVGDPSRGVINRGAVIPAKNVPTLVNLGPAHVNKRQSAGPYKWTATISAMTVGATGTYCRVLDLVKVPTENGARSARVSTPGSTTLALTDRFEQSAGAATGKTLTSGQTWSGGGDADDFTIDATNDRLTRTAVSDTAGTGREIYAGADIAGASARISVGMTYGGANAVGGPQIRRAASDSRLFMRAGGGASSGVWVIEICKQVAGTVTVIGTLEYLGWGYPELTIAAMSDGSWFATSWGGGPIATITRGYDTDLAPGNALAQGKSGVYENYTSASASTRGYSGFYAYSYPAVAAIAFPYRNFQWQPDGSIDREAVGGTDYAYAQGQRGAGIPMLDPSGTNRLLLASADFNPDVAASLDPPVSLSYVVEHRPAYAIGRH